MESSKIVVISDIHLGDGSYTDLFARKDELLLKFLTEHSNADRIILLGDILDAFQAGNIKRIYPAHKAVIDSLNLLADRTTYVQGNHEGGRDVRELLPSVAVCRSLELDGISFEHGDRFDPYAGDMLAGRIHGFFEKLFHSCLRIPLAEYKSDYNNAMHRLFSTTSKFTPPLCKILWKAGFKRASAKLSTMTKYWHACIAGDYNHMFEKVCSWLQQEDAPAALVCGHSHLPGVVKILGKTYANTGSWAASNAQFGMIQNGSIRILDYLTGREFGDEHYSRLRMTAT